MVTKIGGNLNFLFALGIFSPVCLLNGTWTKTLWSELHKSILASRSKTEFFNVLFLPDEVIDRPGSMAPIPASGVPSGILR